MKVLAISGSLRSDSWNRKLLALMKRVATENGAEVSELDLRELDLPVYDHDVELRGLPPAVQKLKAEIEKADVLLIASPEYNHSIPGGLKNAIDWASRAGNSFKGKRAAIAGASNGQYGTVRMQPHLRQVLAAVGILVMPQPQVAVSFAEDAFDGSGELKDAKLAERLKALIETVLKA